MNFHGIPSATSALNWTIISLDVVVPSLACREIFSSTLSRRCTVPPYPVAWQKRR
uniref:Cytochrome c oxidase assembly protein CtaG / Cox11 family n=1 Tax=Arundo donax TaxID=35708 RepID=A0A0A8XNB7_ARUDO